MDIGKGISAGAARAGGAPPGAGGGDASTATSGSPIEFRLDTGSGVPTYLQLVQQVEHALRLGYLKPGDQLPKVRDVVATLAINPLGWLAAAGAAGLDEDGMVALFTSALRDFHERRGGQPDRGAPSGETEGVA
jgi:GntR family transcriptional regulator